MSNLTPEDKKHLQAAAYCIDAMLSGEKLTHPGDKYVVTIESLKTLLWAIEEGKEITFEGGTPERNLEFAKLSDGAKNALKNMWSSFASTYSVADNKKAILGSHGEEVFNELDNLLKQ